MAFHASSYIKTTTVAVQRVRDQLSWSFTARPQAMTIYVRFIESGTVSTANFQRIVIIQGSASSPYFSIPVSAGGLYYIAYHNGTSEVNSILATAPSLGDQVELRATLTSAGVAQLHQSLNAAAETSATAAAARVLPTSWGSSVLFYVNGVTTATGFIALRAVWIGRGILDLASCRRYAGVSL